MHKTVIIWMQSQIGKVVFAFGDQIKSGDYGYVLIWGSRQPPTIILQITLLVSVKQGDYTAGFTF